MKNKNQILTIAIPTYNRTGVLFENIKIISKQIKDWAKIVILDNCSDDEINYLITQESWWTPGLIEVIRNPVNIGGNANILRCIEVCNTKYIWILGDDDYPKKNTIDIIDKYIRYEEIIWLNFYSPDEYQPKREKSYKCNSGIEFLSKLKSINELVFMSNNIYKTSVIKNGIEGAFKNIQMMAPHLIAMLYGLESSKKELLNGKFIITNDEIFESLSNNKDKKTNWDFFRIYTGLMSIYQLKINKNIDVNILRLLKGARKKWLTNIYMIKAFSELAHNSGILTAFRQSNTTLLNLVYIDGFKSLFTIPIYLFSIIFGKLIWRNKSLFKIIKK
jgi:glycosyltransferase involved in cell wall biosynthesis